MSVEQLVLSLALMWDHCMSCVLSLVSQCYYIAVTTRVTPVWIPPHCEAGVLQTSTAVGPWTLVGDDWDCTQGQWDCWAPCMLQKAEQSHVRMERIKEGLLGGTSCLLFFHYLFFLRGDGSDIICKFHLYHRCVTSGSDYKWKCKLMPHDRFLWKAVLKLPGEVLWACRERQMQLEVRFSGRNGR